MNIKEDGTLKHPLLALPSWRATKQEPILSQSKEGRGVCEWDTEQNKPLLTDVHQHFYTPLAASDNLYMGHLTGFEKGLKQMFPV